MGIQFGTGREGELMSLEDQLNGIDCEIHQMNITLIELNNSINALLQKKELITRRINKIMKENE